VQTILPFTNDTTGLTLVAKQLYMWLYYKHMARNPTSITINIKNFAK